MEKFRYVRVALSDISGDQTFCLRCDLKQQELERSVSKQGVVVPVIVTASSPHVVICGHRRVAAARQAELKDLPALELAEPLADEDLFLMAVLSNWEQSRSEHETLLILKQAIQKFKMNDTRLLSELMPAMGLAGKAHLLEEYRQILGLDPLLYRTIESGLLPVRGSHTLAKLNEADQRAFAELCPKGFTPTTNQLLQASGTFYDLCRAAGASLADFLMQPVFKDILDHSKWDSKTKTEKLMKVLHGLSHPRLASYEKHFKAVTSKINSADETFRVEAPVYLEDEGFLLRMKVKNRGELKRVIEQLTDRSDLLNSLFDIML